MTIYTFEKRDNGAYEEFTQDDLMKIKDSLGPLAKEVSFKVYREKETRSGIRRYCSNVPGTCGIMAIDEGTTYAMAIASSLMNLGIDFYCEMQKIDTVDNFKGVPTVQMNR